MKHGEVVHIRVNPEDVMAAIDIVKVSGVYVQGMSIAQVVRLAYSGLAEAARKHGVIPRRDGFEYEAMVKPFLNTGRNAKKLQISSAVESAEASRASFDKPATPVNVSLSRHATDASDKPTPLDYKKARVLRELVELNTRRTADDSNFTVEQRVRMDKLQDVYDLMVSGQDVDISELMGGA